MNTGMVRRIDELGRIVIPKEMRKQLMLKEGESIAFIVDNDKIILQKFSILKKLTPVIQAMLDRVYAKYHNLFLVCDLSQIIVCSSVGIHTYQNDILPSDIKLLVEKGCIEVLVTLRQNIEKLTMIPLLHEGKCIGGLMMLTQETPYSKIELNIINFIKEVIEQEIGECV